MTELDRNNLSALAIFDYVYDRLNKQGCASISASDECRYRGPTGRRCAAGWLIPDDQYNASFEGRTVGDTEVWEAINLPDKYQPLVNALQEMHDSVMRRDVNMWRINMNILRKMVHAYVDN